MFSRSKLHALYKSLVFFRSLLLPAVPNLMFCVFFCMFLYFSVHFCPQLSLIPCFVCICLHILQIFVWFCVVRRSLWHAVPESSWSFNAILRCFLIAVYGNVVFLVQKWMRIIKVSCFSVHSCSQLSPISCFVYIVCIFCRYLCDSVLVRCSLWQAVPEPS